MSYCSIWTTDRTLSGATTPDQSGPGSNGNEGILHISQSSKTEAPPSYWHARLIYIYALLQPKPVDLGEDDLKKSRIFFRKYFSLFYIQKFYLYILILL